MNLGRTAAAGGQYWLDRQVTEIIRHVDPYHLPVEPLLLLPVLLS